MSYSIIYIIWAGLAAATLNGGSNRLVLDQKYGITYYANQVFDAFVSTHGMYAKFPKEGHKREIVYESISLLYL